MLDDEDRAVQRDLPVTTFERTLVDCTTSRSRFQLLANLDDGLRRNIASVRRLRDCVDRLESGPGRRLSVMRWVLDQRPNRYNPGGSHSERRVLDVLVAAGLPEPVQQHRVVVGSKTYFLDFAYPDEKVFIATDSLGTERRALSPTTAGGSPTSQPKAGCLCSSRTTPLTG